MLVEKILPNLLAHCLNYFCKWGFGDVSAVPSPPQHSNVGVRARINFMHTFQSAHKMLEASSGIVGETDSGSSRFLYCQIHLCDRHHHHIKYSALGSGVLGGCRSQRAAAPVSLSSLHGDFSGAVPVLRAFPWIWFLVNYTKGIVWS